MSEIKVGLLALATMAAVIYMSLLITSNQSGFGEYVPYRTVVRDASGIFPKTPIKIAGINAGRIKKIELSNNNAEITFEVLKSVKITNNSRLRIKTVGFLGDKYLEIIIGDDLQRIERMGYIPSEEGGGVETLVRDASEVLKDVKDIVKEIKVSLSSKDGGGLSKIMQDLEVTVANTKDATKVLKEVLSENQDKFNSLVTNLEGFSENLVAEFDKYDKESTLSDLKEIMGNVKEMTVDMKTLMADVKNGKGTIGKLLVEEKIADEVQETLSGVKKLVGKVDQIRTQLNVFTGGNTSAGSESTLGLRIFPAPERFYSLGITTSEFGPIREKHTTTVLNGVKSEEVRKERTKNQYRFNVLIGRKLQNWVFRGGLIESTGGLAVDYRFPIWGSQFSLEVFDYRKDIGPNIRSSFEFQVWNILYGKMSFNDMIEKDRSATISAGLKFSDEDLKGLLGFFL